MTPEPHLSEEDDRIFAKYVEPTCIGTYNVYNNRGQLVVWDRPLHAAMSVARQLDADYGAA